MAGYLSVSVQFYPGLRTQMSVSASQAHPTPRSQPLTAAVAGTAGILLEVGDESVAWAASGSKALAQGLVTH